MMVLVFTATFAIGKPSRALYYLTMMIVNCYFTIMMKLILHRPRPYMVEDSDIKVNGFSSEFGDPSGHTMSCAQVLTTMFLDLNANFKAKNSYLFIGFMSIILVIVGYSRMFNGVHSLDQVIYGALIGLWIAFFGHQCVRADLINHVDKITLSNKKKEEDGPNTFEKIDNKNKITFSTLLYLFGLLTSQLAFLYCKKIFEIPQIWLDRQLQKSGNPGLFTLENSSYIQSGALIMPYALYLGFIYQGQKAAAKPLNILKKGLRILLFGSSLGLAYIPYLAFIGVQNVFEAMLLTVLIPLGSIIFFGGAFFERLIYRPLGL